MDLVEPTKNIRWNTDFIVYHVNVHSKSHGWNPGNIYLLRSISINAIFFRQLFFSVKFVDYYRWSFRDNRIAWLRLSCILFRTFRERVVATLKKRNWIGFNFIIFLIIWHAKSVFNQFFNYFRCFSVYNIFIQLLFLIYRCFYSTTIYRFIFCRNLESF